MRSPCLVLSFLCRTCRAFVALVVDMSQLSPQARRIQSRGCVGAWVRGCQRSAWPVLAGRRSQSRGAKKHTRPRSVSRVKTPSTVASKIRKMGAKMHGVMQRIACPDLEIFEMSVVVLLMADCARIPRSRGCSFLRSESVCSAGLSTDVARLATPAEFGQCLRPPTAQSGPRPRHASSHSEVETAATLRRLVHRSHVSFSPGSTLRINEPGTLGTRARDLVYQQAGRLSRARM